ncbi:hypothetical protein NMG60_11017419 [Bertholletia excelsa]
MSSLLPLSSNSFPFPRPQSPLSDSNVYPIPIPKRSPHSVSRPLICISLSSNSSNYEREEARWLREEQRWLREEQRWLREEARWGVERESLLREISALKLRIEELERRGQSDNLGASMSEVAALLQAVKEGELRKTVNRIAEGGSSAVPMEVESVMKEEVMVEKEVITEENKQVKEIKERKALRMGSEGEDVQAMQEALQKLGFYSGEEDMEYSSFSSGTERAVKTWQASIGAHEDGIMTGELLERLFVEQQIGSIGLSKNADPKQNVSAIPKEVVNGSTVASVKDISEIQQTVVEDDGVTEVEASQHRVFLLGENRWEEPSRLGGRGQQVGGAKSKNPTTKCLSCRGEGRLLCTECDGTGEPNVEPQFLEWLDEGAKCPYCEGLGYTICDVCDGRTVV